MMGEGIEPDGVQAFDEEAANRGGYRALDGRELMELLVKDEI